MSSKNYWTKQLAIYDSIVEKCPRFERKGKTMPYTSANGYMFSLLNKDGELGIRFSKEEQEKLIVQHQTSLYKSYGAIMKGYILITPEMMKDHDLIISQLNRSFDYVMSLPPK